MCVCVCWAHFGQTEVHLSRVADAAAVSGVMTTCTGGRNPPGGARVDILSLRQIKSTRLFLHLLFLLLLLCRPIGWLAGRSLLNLKRSVVVASGTCARMTTLPVARRLVAPRLSVRCDVVPPCCLAACRALLPSPRRCLVFLSLFHC